MRTSLTGPSSYLPGIMGNSYLPRINVFVDTNLQKFLREILEVQCTQKQVGVSPLEGYVPSTSLRDQPIKDIMLNGSSKCPGHHIFWLCEGRSVASTVTYHAFIHPVNQGSISSNPLIYKGYAPFGAKLMY